MGGLRLHRYCQYGSGPHYLIVSHPGPPHHAPMLSKFDRVLWPRRLRRLLLLFSQASLRLESFSRCQGDALSRAKRVVREEWPQRVASTVHDALRRQLPEGANASQAGTGTSASEQVRVCLRHRGGVPPVRFLRISNLPSNFFFNNLAEFSVISLFLLEAVCNPVAC